MRKSILAVLLISACFMFTHCGKKNAGTSPSYGEYSYKDLIESETIYCSKDTTLGISVLSDFKIYKDSFAVLTDLFTGYIYRYDFNKKAIMQLGNKGRGPGEYLQPYKLYIKDNLVYYSDRSAPGIECFDINGKNSQKVYSERLETYVKTFVVNDSSKVCGIMDPMVGGYFVTSSAGKHYVKAPAVFKDSKHPIFPISGAYLNKNKLYFAYLIDSKIYSVDLANNKEEQYVLDYPGFCNWDKIEKFTEKVIDDIHERYTTIAALLGFEYKNKTYFYIYLCDTDDTKNNKEFICSATGEILFAVRETSPYFIQAVSAEKSYSYSIDGKQLLIKSFIWNKKFKDLLDAAK